ncbi:MAG TPA: cobalamin-binding protein [Bdellovibrionota bacterium]|nr:cobalamin-binding protein [Bdellovibrionota bacterium]
MLSLRTVNKGSTEPRRKPWAPALAALLLLCVAARAGAETAPRRIVTLMPSLGELAADLLQTDLNRIVGISEYTDYPPGLKKAASIGRYDRFNIESVVALKPDLVLASQDGNPKDPVLHLRELGLNVLVVRTETFDEIKESMRLTGTALGFASRGAQMASQFEQGLSRIRDRAAKRTGRPRVLLQIGDEPLVVAGGKSFLNESLTTIGALNVYSDSGTRYPKPSVEDVIQRKPEIILILALGRQSGKSFEAAVRRWKDFQSIPAVRNGKVFVIEADALLRPTLRLLEGLSILEKKVFDAE